MKNEQTLFGGEIHNKKVVTNYTFKEQIVLENGSMIKNVIAGKGGSSDDRSFYIKKVRPSNEKYLLLLACNGGASVGNYFLGSGWRQADYILRRDRKNILFGACSSVLYHFPDDNGSIVFEFENHRVESRGEDIPMPSSNEFTCLSENGRFDINILVDGMKKALTRVFDDYKIEKIYAVLTPNAYKMGFYAAVTEMNCWDRVIMCDVNTMGTISFWVKLFRVFQNNGDAPTGIMNNEFLEYNKPLFRARVTDERFQYWKHERYHSTFPYDLTVEWFKELGSNKKFQIFPIESKDASLSLDQKIEKYSFFPDMKNYQWSHSVKLDSLLYTNRKKLETPSPRLVNE